MDNELQEMERILQQITNSTGTAEHLIQHIQSLYPPEKQTLPGENIKITTQLKNIIYVIFLVFNLPNCNNFIPLSVLQIQLMILLKGPRK